MEGYVVLDDGGVTDWKSHSPLVGYIFLLFMGLLVNTYAVENRNLGDGLFIKSPFADDSCAAQFTVAYVGKL